MNVCAIVVAAGKGLRLKSRVSKPLVEIGKKPVLMYSLEALNSSPYINDIVVIANLNNRDSIIKLVTKLGIDKIFRVVLGGKRRQDSVKNGLAACPRQADWVLIHDAGRPFIDRNLISAVIRGAKKSGSAVVAVPVKATIKRVTKLQGSRVKLGVVKETLNRDELWEIQTPQVFRRDIISKAYEKFGRHDVTDDAMLVEKLGKTVGVVMGSYSNIKITTPEDMITAGEFAKRWKRE